MIQRSWKWGINSHWHTGILLPLLPSTPVSHQGPWHSSSALKENKKEENGHSKSVCKLLSSLRLSKIHFQY